MTAVLELMGLSKIYHSAGFGGIGSQPVAVFENLSLKLYQGEILVLLGKSGSGKTTLARCVLRLETIQAGSIKSAWGTIAGAASPLIPRDHLYRLIQLVPQAISHSLNPFSTLKQTLSGIIKQTPNPRSLQESLSLSGLDSSLFDRRPDQLSGGQRQRLLLARALIMNPRLIIFDEPVSSLDPSIQARILNTLLRLREQCGMSYLFITHDLDVAEYIGDRIVRLEDGRLRTFQP